ncbi:MAG: hypothetical protein U9N77_00715 [Thermodesulfobacteriota bacterium]|nr:hypothetical protein [Thermodesulfobacteriota bacterium]
MVVAVIIRIPPAIVFKPGVSLRIKKARMIPYNRHGRSMVILFGHNKV